MKTTIILCSIFVGVVGCVSTTSEAGDASRVGPTMPDASADSMGGNTPADAAAPEPAAADEVMRLLAGRFDSRSQSLEQPSYFDVQLLGCLVEAPELGERVLYIEQAMRGRSSEPYRQRLYVIEPGAAPSVDAVSHVFGLEAPEEFVGLCSRGVTRVVSAAEAYERTGCEVELTRTADGFDGATRGAECRSTLRGASYATSEVELREERITSWDRGYDGEGLQVWGATEGPYRFERQSE